jgi:CubicO group peptidase (beta-lactamase class C family)
LKKNKSACSSFKRNQSLFTSGFLVCFMLTSLYLFSQDSLQIKIDKYVMQQQQATMTPGLAVGVIRQGKVLLARGYGLSNVELATYTDANSVFQLLSISKQFIAAGIMLIAESGKISLDQSITSYLPDVPSAWENITVRNLLNHTSGIMDLTDIHPFFEQIREDATPQQLLEPVYREQLLFHAGTQWRYSNSNYFLLGLIIERISGKKLQDFLRENIFQPLGMTATRMNDATDVIPYRVSGYNWIGEDAEKMPAMISGYHGIKNVLQNAIYISPTRLWAAGGIVSTINDLIKWDSSLRNNVLLKKESYLQMVMPGKLSSGTETNYGFGNELFEIHGHKIAGHQGGGMAFNTAFLQFLNDDVTVIVLCNQTTCPSKQMAVHIASFLIDDLDYAAAPNKHIKESKQITALFKSVLLNAKNGKVEPELFASEAQETAKFISRAGPDFLGSKGELKSVNLVDEKNENGKHSYTYQTIFEKATLLWKFELNNDNKILSLNPIEQ